MKPNIIFLTRSVSFPNGLAPTQRVKLLARGLAESGLNVSILCTQVTEKPPSVENHDAKGIWNGIQFEYTTGTTIRSKRFLIRRWIELRGILVAIYRLIMVKVKQQERFCCIYYYANNLVFAPSQWIFLLVAQLLQLPVVLDLREKPWTLPQVIPLINNISPLYGANGVVVISKFLKNWVDQEQKRINRRLSILEVPILVDIFEQKSSAYPRGLYKVLFAGSPVYDQTIKFILDAMDVVWDYLPECKLIITGSRPGELTSEQIKKMLQKQDIKGCVELTGYLPRNELLDRYSQSSVLLIPLFDDDRSKARFPTKIGEYLASSRPIITNRVGEVTRFLVDRENAYVCEPGDPLIYGEKILEALNNPMEAHRIGIAGRQVAEKNFQYSIHTRCLANLIDSLVLKD